MIRLLTLFVAILVLASLSVGEAQQPKKIPRVAFLSASVSGADSERYERIRQHLRELGYIERQNISIEYRSAGGSLDRYREVADELVRRNVDIIVVGGGTIYVEAVKKATNTIPIVMTGPGSDPVQAGLIASLARPGGNITGLTNLARELGGKRLELLDEAMSQLTHVAVLYDPTNPAHASELEESLRPSARVLKLTLHPREVKTSKEFDKVFATMAKQRSDALYALGGPLLIANEKRIVAFALKNRLPSTYGRRQSVEVGGLMYYGADVADGYRRVAIYVDKILKGAKPGDLPVEQPTKFELVINLKTAKQIGLTIPPNVLARADRVIK